MAIYSIKDLESIVGIKAHTIRMWEHRYKILTPSRTETNIRYYTDENLQLYLNISLLNRNGIKISAIAKMKKAEIEEKVKALSDVNFEQSSQLDALTISMISMDQKMFSRIINADIKQMGFKRTMLEVIVPFIEKIHMLGMTGSVTALHSQFITNVICQKIIVATDQLDYCCNSGSKSFLMYSPEENYFDLTMLFAYYLLKEQGGKIIYLGGGVRFEDLANLKEQPDYFFAMLNTMSLTSCQKYINALSGAFPESQLLYSGFSLFNKNLEFPQNALALRGLPETVKFIESLNEPSL